ncbi:DUF2238 domain-containing protein [Microbacterium sp. NPDC055521]
MKEDFLRPPRTAAEWTADALRLVGILGVIAAAIRLEPTDAGIAALALPALVLPRMLGMRAWFDTTAGATVLAAAWSNVFELYAAISWWDLAIHFACTGVLAIITAEVLTRAGVVDITASATSRSRTPLVLMPLIALALSAVWEMIEWFGSAYISDQIHVGYQDTIGDMVLGGLGGVVAGVMLALSDVRRVPGPEHLADAVLSDRRG